MEPRVHLLTERLRGEPLRADHLDAVDRLRNDPQVAPWLGGPADRDEIAARLAHHARHWREHGFGAWLLLDRATGAVVGQAGLHRVHIGGADEVEAGWTVTPERWGEGLAAEAGAASLEAGFAHLGLPSVVAFTQPDNAASRRVMEKLGMRYERDVEWAGLPHVLYRIEAPATVR